MLESGLQFLSEFAYVLVLVLTCADFLVHRDSRRRDAVLMFASIAVFVVVRWAITASSAQAPRLLDLGVLLIMAKPFLTLRLVRHFRPVPAGILAVGFFGMVACWLILSVVHRPLTPLTSLVIVAYFVLVEGYAGVAFIRGALASAGQLRRRMAYAAGGSVLLGAVLSIAGLNILAPDSAIYTKPISSMLTGLGALSYYLGFAPPGWIGTFWRTLRLGGQAMVLVAAATCIVAIGTLGSVVWQLRDTWSGQINMGQRNLALIAAQITADKLQGERADVIQVSIRPLIRESVAKDPWNIGRLQPTVERFRQDSTSVDSYAVIDSNGYVRASSEVERSSYGRSYANREDVRAVRRTGASYISNPYTDEETPRPVFAVAAPVFGADGELRAIIRKEVDVALLVHSLELPGITLGTQITVISPSGSIAAHPDPARILRPAVEESALADAALTGSSGIDVVPASSDKPERLVSYAPVPGTGWGVLVSVPTGDIYGPIVAATLRASLVSLGLIVVLALGAAVFVTRVFRPLRALSDAAHQFGGGDYARRVVPEGAADVRELAERFNGMADAVSRQTAALAIQDEESRGRATILQALLDLTESVGAEANVRDVAERIAEHSIRMLPVASCGILMPTSDGGLEFVGTAGRDRESLRGVRMAPNVGMSSQVLRTGVSLIIHDVRNEPAYVQFVPDIQSAVLIALHHGDAILGVMNFQSDTIGAFGEGEVALARIVAAHAAVSLARAQLFEQLQRQNIALEEGSRHKSEFLANMSHELRTPLNAINGFSQLLLIASGDEFDQQTRDSYLSTIHESGQHLLQLINDILDLSKVEAGKMDLRKTSFNVAETTARVLATVQPLSSSKKIMMVDETADAGLMTADEGKFKQILYNLLSNAIKFTPENGCVLVLANRSADGVQITVADTGIGIATEDQARVFEEFQQVEAGADRRFEGTGLGLSLTRRLVELHGGRIWLESAVGHGSQFHFFLPHLASDDAITNDFQSPERMSSAQPNMSVESSDQADRPLVLIVEDDRRSANLIAAYLKRGGYRSQVVADGSQALAAARQHRPMAITLDVMLPGLDGWEVLRELKLDEATRDIPVLMVSIVDDKQFGFALGAVDYLVKPVDGNALLATLDRFSFTSEVRNRVVHILVVDDEQSAVELLAAILEPAGFSVLRAYGGAQAIESARTEQPDLIVLDLMMPEISGFDVVAALGLETNTRKIPIIILTAKNVTEEDRQTLHGTVSAVFQKGNLVQDELIAELRKILDHNRDHSGVVQSTAVGDG